MDAMEIKGELRRMIEQETDVNLLEAIRALLEKASLNPALKEVLTNRALKAEADIASRRVYPRDEVIRMLGTK